MVGQQLVFFFGLLPWPRAAHNQPKEQSNRCPLSHSTRQPIPFFLWLLQLQPRKKELLCWLRRERLGGGQLVFSFGLLPMALCAHNPQPKTKDTARPALLPFLHCSLKRNFISFSFSIRAGPQCPSSSSFHQLAH